MPTKYAVYQCRTCDHVWEPGRPEVKFCKHCGGSDIFRPPPDTPQRQGRKTTVTVKYSSATPVNVSPGGPAESAAVAKPRSGTPALAWFGLALIVGAGGLFAANGFELRWPVSARGPSEPAQPAVAAQAEPPARPSQSAVIPAADTVDEMQNASIGELITTWQRGSDELRHRFGHRRLRLVTRTWMPPGQSTMILNQSPMIVCHLPQGWVMRRPPDPNVVMTVSGRLRGIEGAALALVDCRFEQ